MHGECWRKCTKFHRYVKNSLFVRVLEYHEIFSPSKIVYSKIRISQFYISVLRTVVVIYIYIYIYIW